MALLGGFGLLSLIGSIPYSAFYVALAEGLPKNIRGGAFATIYAVAIASFGGTAQLVVTWLIHVYRQCAGAGLVPAVCGRRWARRDGDDARNFAIEAFCERDR